MPQHLRIEDYTYHLPDERIARHPLEKRDASQLLVYQNGHITDRHFYELPQLLPADSLLCINQTRVVQARLLFRKESGSTIEVFCLEPHEQYADVPTAMAQHGHVWWRCLVGGAAKWKKDMVLTLNSSDPAFTLSAKIIERTTTDFVIELSWDDANLSFAAVLEAVGHIPLPPYMQRSEEAADKERYQTVFAKEEGSVAAPTASLHFTPEVMDALKGKGVQTAALTLHVGAGTFKPVKSETVAGHEMHAEWMEVSRETITQLISHQGPVIASGTTAMRTLESLYHIGCKAARQPTATAAELALTQWEVYEQSNTLPKETALQAILDWLKTNNLQRLITRTQILIAPGYTFKIVDGLVTNFHQPQSTLLLLVAAFVGENAWRNIYQHAMDHNYRFLSYGDASLLWRH